MKEAYEAKKWAFVTDYARLWIIYHYGGIYLDTDVEIIKPLDCLLKNEAYFGLEDNNFINTGVGFGAKKGNDVVFGMMSDYSNEHFLNSDGTFNKTTCPVRNTRVISKLFPIQFDGAILQVENATFYPPEYFCPLSPDGKQMIRTDNTFSIHWFSASWLDSEEAIIHEWRVFKGKCENRFGRKLGSITARFAYLVVPRKRKILKKYSKQDQ